MNFSFRKSTNKGNHLFQNLLIQKSFSPNENPEKGKSYIFRSPPQRRDTNNSISENVPLSVRPSKY